VVHAHIFLGCPEPELLSPTSGLEPPAAKGEKAAGTRGHNAQATKIRKAPKYEIASLAHYPARRHRADSRDPNQLLE
jgi:hypothetical protein